MSILQILILAAIAVIIGFIPRGRTLVLAGASMFVLFWLAQPDTVLPSLPFWLQIFTAFIVVLVWWITASPELRRLSLQWPALAVLAGVILLATLVNRLPVERVLSISTANPVIVLGALLMFGVLLFILNGTARFSRVWAAVGFLLLLIVFLIIKSPALTAQLVDLLSSIRGRDITPDASLTLVWLGYSYLAFRLLHVLRDWQTGLLPAVNLDEFICYAVFFPSFISGPIDRMERFTKDLRTSSRLTNEDWLFAGQRLAVGLFKKFVLADWLAWLSLSDALVGQARSGMWLWLFVYAYAFRIYFDFSGYTDIAIGLGRLIGIRLPENFAAPYLKPNLTQFWNSWHMTLTQWFRSYFFNPITRYLRTRSRPIPAWVILLVTQFATMSLIGLWHGITWNFLLWGGWHAIGLFLQNRWSEWMRVRFPDGGAAPRARSALAFVGTVLTFHYVALGWVFFAISTPQLSVAVLMKLFGMS